MQRRKCDEGLPSCSRCRERSVDCIYKHDTSKPPRKMQATGYGFRCLGPVTPPVKTLPMFDGGTCMSTTTAEPSMTPEGCRSEVACSVDTYYNTSNYESDIVCEEESSISGSNHGIDSPEKSIRSPLPSPHGPHQNEDQEHIRVISLDTPDSTSESPNNIIQSSGSLSLSSAHLSSPILRVASPAQSPPFEYELDLDTYFYRIFSPLLVSCEDDVDSSYKIIEPLTKRCFAVKYAIFALASSHAEPALTRFHANRDVSEVFYNQVLSDLSRRLKFDLCGQDRTDLLAAIVFLICYEVVSCARYAPAY